MTDTTFFPQPVPESTFLPSQMIPCTRCSQSGVYVDYGGPLNPHVITHCPDCHGTGWRLP